MQRGEEVMPDQMEPTRCLFAARVPLDSNGAYAAIPGVAEVNGASMSIKERKSTQNSSGLEKEALLLGEQVPPLSLCPLSLCLRKKKSGVAR
eukprot:scaffold42681_cov20-Tisochrysis_lutea.AAC.4